MVQVVATDRKNGDKLMSFQELSTRERGSKDALVTTESIKVLNTISVQNESRISTFFFIDLLYKLCYVPLVFGCSHVCKPVTCLISCFLNCLGMGMGFLCFGRYTTFPIQC